MHPDIAGEIARQRELDLRRRAAGLRLGGSLARRRRRRPLRVRAGWRLAEIGLALTTTGGQAGPHREGNRRHAM